MKTLDASTTALVLIDLQRGIVSRQLAPITADEVVRISKDLAARFRAAGAPVVLVHVDFGPDGRLAPSREVDRPMQSSRDPDFADYVDGLVHDGDMLVEKHHWGAFIGTDLDVLLRRRGVRTVVLAGIATNLGVESTARSGWELGYDIVLVEDAMASISAEFHDFAVANMFPLIGRVTAAKEIVLA